MMLFIRIIKKKNNMLISRTWLQTYFKSELPSAEKIAETLMMHSFELEGIKEKGDDFIIDIDVLPNRAHDCLSYAGVAKEYSILTGYEMNMNRYYYHDSVKYDDSKISITINNNQQCYRYMARKISNVVVENSPGWMRQRIESIGQRSINNIVDATNYVMYDTGNPMHAFDADKVIGGINVRNAKQGETMTALGGEIIELIESDLVIADDEGVLALAGIKGGTKAEVTKDTKNIILEVANFNPTTTRLTSRRVKILTDSSKRFENEISSEIATHAMESISRLVGDMMENESIGEINDIYPNPEKEHSISVRHDHINQLLGTDLSKKEVKNIFSKMDYQNHLEDSTFIVKVPFNRLDLRIAEDLIEEVGRVYGYFNIPAKDLDGYLFKPQINKSVYVENKLKQLLIELGFSEIKNYSFVKKGDIQLANPLSSNKSFLRKNLHKELLVSLDLNASNIDFLGLDRILIFEIGRVYGKESEFDKCCIAISNKNKQSNKKYGTERIQLEAVINSINTDFGINLDVTYENNSVTFDIEQCSEGSSYDGLLETVSYEDDALFHTVSSLPYMTRDVSFWAPKNLEEVVLRGIISSVNSKYLKKVFLFDNFEKEGQISYGFSLIFQSNDKTLTDDEVALEMFKIEKSLTEKGCKIR